MSRRTALRLTAVSWVLFGCAASSGREPGEDVPRAALFQQRQAVLQKFQNARDSGEREAAAAAAEQAIAIHRRLLAAPDRDAPTDSQKDGTAALHLELADLLGFVAQWQEERGEIAAAVARRKEILSLLADLRGPDHWEVSDARLDLQYAELLQSMTAAQRERLATAERDADRVVSLHGEGKWAEAIPLALEVCAIRRELLGDQHPHYAISLNNLASLYESMAQYDRAESLHLQTLAIRKKTLGEEHPRYATSLNNLGLLYHSKGEYAKALPLHLRAREIRKKALGEDHPDYTTSLNNLGLLYYSVGAYAQAEPFFVQALEIRKKVLGEDHPSYATSLLNLAALYRSMGLYAKAEPLYVQTIAIEKKLLGEEHPRYATSLNNLGILYRWMGDYAKAELLYLQSLEIRRNALGEEHPAYGGSLNNLALLYQSMGEYAKAEPFYLKAIEVDKKTLPENHPDRARSLTNLAALYVSMGDYSKAEPLMLQARGITEKSLGEDHPDYATSLNNLAFLYRALEDYPKAETYFLQTLDLTKKALGEDHPDYSTSLSNLAGLYYAMGAYAKAEPLFLQVRETRKKSLGEDHPDYAISLNNLATYYTSIGEYSKAEQLYLQAHEICKKALAEDHPDYATSLNNLAALYQSMGEYAQAEPLFREALARSHQWTGELLDYLPENRARTLLSRRPGCDALLNLLRRLPEPRDRDAYLEVWQSRGRASTVAAARRQVLAGSPDAEPLLDQLQAVAQQLAQLALAVPRHEQREARRQRLESLSKEKERLETDLARVSRTFRRTRQTAEATPEDLVGLLPPGTAVVEFLSVQVWNPPADGRGRPVAERHYDAFVLRPGDDGPQVTWVQLGPAAPIDRAAARWRKTLLEQPAVQPDLASAQELRTRAWSKIEPHLAGCSTLLIVPDGLLCFVPWAALPGKRPGTYLLEDYALATVPAARQLYRLLTETASPSDERLLVGGVDYDQPPSPAESLMLASRTRSPAVSERPVWTPLPGTAGEVEAIRQLASSPPPQVLGGAAACETSLRLALPGKGVIHLATHGFFADERFRSMYGHDVQSEQLFGGGLELATAAQAQVTTYNPLILSGIVLAGANLPPKTDALGLPTGEDGILTAEEIVGLDLRAADLVVLSACETGMGRVAGGEGVLGLQRAFHLAGARTVVASLWKVDDQATRALMVEFYQNLWERNLGKLESLRQAQLTMIRDYDPAAGSLRGPGAVAAVDRATLEQAPALKQPLPPFYWAAFAASGDWR